MSATSRRPPARSNVMIECKCGHTVLHKEPLPKEDERIFCRLCADYTLVRGYAHLWNVKCRHCRYTHAIRMISPKPRELAQRAAYRHSTKYGHVVDVFRGVELVDAVRPNGGAALSMTYTRKDTERLLRDVAKPRNAAESIDGRLRGNPSGLSP